MPITHSAYKRLRQAKKRTRANNAMKARIDKARKELKKLAGSGVEASADVLMKLRAFGKLVDQAKQKKILKKNTAARVKSRISRLLNARSRS